MTLGGLDSRPRLRGGRLYAGMTDGAGMGVEEAGGREEGFPLSREQEIGMGMAVMPRSLSRGKELRGGVIGVRGAGLRCRKWRWNI